MQDTERAEKYIDRHSLFHYGNRTRLPYIPLKSVWIVDKTCGVKPDSAKRYWDLVQAMVCLVNPSFGCWVQIEL